MKSNKTLTSVFVLGAFVLTSTPSYAVVGIKPTIRAERVELRKEIHDTNVEARVTLKQERVEAKTTITASRLEMRKKQLTTVYNAIKKNLTSRFTLLSTTIKAQVQAKIDAKKAEGKDVSAAVSLMATFSTDAYTKDLAALDAKYAELLASTEPKKQLGELNKLAQVVRKDLNDMRKVLLDSFRLAIRAK